MRTIGGWFTAVVVAGMALILISGSPVRAAGAQHEHDGHEHAEEAGPREVTVVGEVIDHVCYIRHDSRGEAHRKCAEYCAGLGITLAILNEENDEILLALPEGHANPNEKLMAHIAERVKGTGTIRERGGLRGIEIRKVERLEGP
jgi:hypothetical protein